MIACLSLLAAAATTAVDAPIAEVTVFSDRARVTRVASFELTATERIELPALPDTADPSTVRVDAAGAEVLAVDLARLELDELPLEQAREALAGLEGAEERLAAARGERAAHASALAAMARLAPTPAQGDPSRPPQKMDPSGWAASEAFLAGRRARLLEKLRELDGRLEDLEREHARALEKARRLGDVRRGGGYRVAVRASGRGRATLRLSYMVARARWYPTYDIQLSPRTNEVQVAFLGRVSQETGEDWRDAALTLSTAVPATSTVFPRLSTWKLGERERFIPTPVAQAAPAPPAPPVPPLPARPEREAEVLRWRLDGLIDGKKDEGKDRAGPAPSIERPPDGKKQAELAIKSFREQASSGTMARPTATVPSGSSNIMGTVLDASTRQPVADVVVVATSPALAGEQVVVTDATGFYRISQLPVGEYTLRLEREDFRPYARTARVLAPDTTLRVNIDMLPEALMAESIVVVGRAPTIDVGSSSTGVSLGPSRSFESLASYSGPPEPAQVKAGTLAPPPGYERPRFAPELPASLAGGHDLSYPALRRESIGSGETERRVALFTQRWPVTVERRIYPALAREAFMVAELKNPSAQPLPGGTASLAVGDDPAGSARLQLVAPGESFALPLGRDRDIHPVRNVRLVQSEHGFISKVELGEYTVVDEVANPYPFPMKARVYDQWPVSDEKDLEVKLLEVEPRAIQDKVKGSLEWQLTVPPGGKASVKFTYSVRRPKDRRLEQLQ